MDALSYVFVCRHASASIKDVVKVASFFIGCKMKYTKEATSIFVFYTKIVDGLTELLGLIDQLELEVFCQFLLSESFALASHEYYKISGNKITNKPMVEFYTLHNYGFIENRGEEKYKYLVELKNKRYPFYKQYFSILENSEFFVKGKAKDGAEIYSLTSCTSGVIQNISNIMQHLDEEEVVLKVILFIRFIIEKMNLFNESILVKIIENDSLKW